MLQFKFARALTQKHIKKSNLEQLKFHWEFIKEIFAI